jgi:hypothetical protein
MWKIHCLLDSILKSCCAQHTSWYHPINFLSTTKALKWGLQYTFQNNGETMRTARSNSTTDEQPWASLPQIRKVKRRAEFVL